MAAYADNHRIGNQAENRPEIAKKRNNQARIVSSLAVM